MTRFTGRMPGLKPPFFVPDSVSDSGLTIQVIGEDGEAHTFHVTEALALIECRTLMDPSVMAEHADGLAIGDGREADGLAIPDRPISYGPARSPADRLIGSINRPISYGDLAEPSFGTIDTNEFEALSTKRPGRYPARWQGETPARMPPAAAAF